MGSSTARRERQRSAKVETTFNRALQKHKAGQWTAAKAAYRQIIKAQPDHFGALINLGLMAFHAGDFESATTFILRATLIEPNDARAHYNLGSALFELGRLDDAVTSYTRALELDPNHAAANLNLGNALRLQGKLDHAVATCARAIELAPLIPEAHNNLGCALQEQGNLDAAVSAFQEAVRLNPDSVKGIVNLGSAYHEQGAYDEAHSAFKAAIRIDPDHAKANKLRGAVLHCQGKYDVAKEALDKAIEINPGDHELFVRRAQIRLSDADFVGGWGDYLMRYDSGNMPSDISRQRLSEPLSGKRIFVLRDQGLGDEIFFLRFVAILKEMGAWIAYRTDSRIAGMLERLPFVDQIFEEHAEPDGIDRTFLAGDLPFILGMKSVTDIPPSIKLTVAQESLDKVKNQLRVLGAPPYLGVTWSAGSGAKGNLSKWTPPERLGKALRSTAGTVVVVQRNPEADDMRRFDHALGRSSYDFSALNNDLEAMLALMDVLDDYICVSNTNVHLRAARGHTCRVLIPNPPEFRWMNSCPVSPWFPGTSLYRKSYEGGWDNAFKILAADLTARYPANPASPA